MPVCIDSPAWPLRPAVSPSSQECDGKASEDQQLDSSCFSMCKGTALSPQPLASITLGETFGALKEGGKQVEGAAALGWGPCSKYDSFSSAHFPDGANPGRSVQSTWPLNNCGCARNPLKL